MTTKRPLPRYTPVLVADPTPPLPPAAPAPAAEAVAITDSDAAEIGREYMAWVARFAPDAWWNTSPIEIATQLVDDLDDARAELEKYRADSHRCHALASEAEAERDRLSAENARLARQAAIERDAAKAAEAELAAVRGAMPDPALLDYAAGQLSVASRNVHIASSTADQYRDTEGVLARAAARIRALATAAPTPPAAEAGAGGEWARGDWKIEHGDWHWLLIEGDPGPTQWEWYEGGGPPDDESWWVRDGYEPEGRVLFVGPPVSPPPGWEAALDQPQEADHA